MNSKQQQQQQQQQSFYQRTKGRNDKRTCKNISWYGTFECIKKRISLCKVCCYKCISVHQRFEKFVWSRIKLTNTLEDTSNLPAFDTVDKNKLNFLYSMWKTIFHQLTNISPWEDRFCKIIRFILRKPTILTIFSLLE